MKKPPGWWSILGLIYFILLCFYSVFSFTLTDPNLVLSSWPPYWQFQQWLWQTFFINEQLLTFTYLSLITLLITTYLLLLRQLQKSTTLLAVTWQKLFLYGCIFTLPLLISYNALSHDVFNYIFNAKMVVIYQADPHLNVALDFGADPWTRFMHNTHTPAPYGYGWTGLSLLPFWLGQLLGGKFVPTWFLFRVMSLISLAWTLAALWWVGTRTQRGPITWSAIGLVVFSPLVLLEIISNSHNDLWMMAPAILSLGIAALPQKKWWHVAMASGLLFFSIAIKFASVVLLPLSICLALSQFLPLQVRKLLHRYWPLIAASLLFLPLLSARSQQFHPWYLTWVIVWLPLFGERDSVTGLLKLSTWEKTAQWLVLVLSFSALFRYAPWLWAGGFENGVLTYQKLVTWIPAGVVLVFFGVQKVRQWYTR